jgi:hypothetical protein
MLRGRAHVIDPLFLEENNVIDPLPISARFVFEKTITLY